MRQRSPFRGGRDRREGDPDGVLGQAARHQDQHDVKVCYDGRNAGTDPLNADNRVGLRPLEGPRKRGGNNASFIDAWETAVTRITKEPKEAAVARATNLLRTIPSGDLLALRKAFKNNHFELKDELAPSDELVELRMEMIENGEQKAEPMGKITSKAWDDDPDVPSGLDEGWLHQGSARQGKMHRCRNLEKNCAREPKPRAFLGVTRPASIPRDLLCRISTRSCSTTTRTSCWDLEFVICRPRTLPAISSSIIAAQSAHDNYSAIGLSDRENEQKKRKQCPRNEKQPLKNTQDPRAATATAAASSNSINTSTDGSSSNTAAEAAAKTQNKRRNDHKHETTEDHGEEEKGEEKEKRREEKRREEKRREEKRREEKRREEREERRKKRREEKREKRKKRREERREEKEKRREEKRREEPREEKRREERREEKRRYGVPEKHQKIAVASGNSAFHITKISKYNYVSQ